MKNKFLKAKQKMNAVDIEKLNQLISRTDMSGNDKVKWLVDFIDGREFEQQKRSYSEEEVLELLRNFYYSFDPIKNPSHTNTIPLWFEQFKKK